MTSPPRILLNPYQRTVVIGAVLNLILILLFPPFRETSIVRGTFQNFDSFCWILSGDARLIHGQLLGMEAIFLISNALAGWLVMQHSGADAARPVQYNQGLAIFGAVNFGLVFSFPPFEQYSRLIRIAVPQFDAFHFMFGEWAGRALFVPMLYLECTLVAVNLLLLHLMFNAVRRRFPAGQAQPAEAPPAPQ